jgi:hypothetical protein
MKKQEKIECVRIIERFLNNEEQMIKEQGISYTLGNARGTLKDVLYLVNGSK